VNRSESGFWIYDLLCPGNRYICLPITRSNDLTLNSRSFFFVQGKVHNPSGAGVNAVSSQASAKFLKHKNPPPVVELETKVKEGTAKRNITRKKTDSKDTGNYDSRNKKQGGHGKGQWKDDELVLDESAVEPVDKKDPLYDEQQAAYILSSHEAPVTLNFDPTEGKAVYGPMLTQSEFKLQVQDVLQEYFDSCDVDEVIRSLEELQCKEFHPDVVKKVVSVSLDKHPRERELVSRLLTCLHPTPLSDADMEQGFDILLDSLDDLTTDVPDAKVCENNEI
jgi:hypothetical protein